MRVCLIAAAIVSLAVEPAFAEGDPAKGKTAFNQCRACHSLDKGKNGVGPSLHGVFGRTAGTAEKYVYSTDMKAAGERGLKWDEQTIFDYLADPAAFLKKYLAKDSVANKMPNKFPSETLRRDVISYLKEAAK